MQTVQKSLVRCTRYTVKPVCARHSVRYTHEKIKVSNVASREEYEKARKDLYEHLADGHDLGGEEDMQFGYKDLGKNDPELKEHEENLRSSEPKGIPEIPTYSGPIGDEKAAKYKREMDEELKKKASGILSYEGTFRDEMSTEPCTVYVRGDQVCLKIAEPWQFVGEEWDVLQPTHKLGKSIMEKLEVDEEPLFTMTEDKHMTAFSVEYHMPVEVVVRKKVQSYPMRVQIQVDHEKARQGHSQLFLLTFQLPQKTIKSEIRKSMNLCLQDIKESLPPSMKLHACWNCKHSEYSPWGESFFGGLGCLVNKVGQKRLQGSYEKWLSKDRDVQENRVCEKWEERMEAHFVPDEKEFKRNRFTAKLDDLSSQ
eukprot:TRINITY_DN13043_c0_g1_i1.p1 TRINITY_DN13043_c0_g1~~TRINITY_DN13043_c0_g1_i1.p1  ORF type:complete len:368 (-),score=78.22 TRINITY_DN13043_c0_g1_i1:8-1111(-)